jgi:ubiquinone biosynthesis accessory factor UbiJ
MDLTLQMAVVSSFVNLLNKALVYDPGTQVALQKIGARSLAIISSQPTFEWQLSVEAGQIKMCVYSEQPANCELHGKILDILSLLKNPQYNLAGSGVEVRGDLSLLETWRNTLANIDWDWGQALQESVAKIIGNPNSAWLQSLVQVLQSQATWAKQKSQVIPAWVQDFLVEELKCAPSNYEIQDFCLQVDDVRAATDRLEKRLEQLVSNSPLREHNL